jgi:hypothetical protein
VRVRHIQGQGRTSRLLIDVPIRPSRQLAFNPVVTRRIHASIPAAVAAGTELVHDLAMARVPIGRFCVPDH